MHGVRPKILFYSEVDFVGGHELMFLKLFLFADMSRVDYVFYVSRFNLRLIEKIQEVAPHCKIYTHSIKVTALHGAINRLRFLSHWRYRRIIKIESPSVVVLLQGLIELSSLPLLHNDGVPKVSYIPQVIPLVESGAKFGRLRDYLNRSLFIRVRMFITIDEYQMSLLEDRHQVKSSNISIVRNGIDVSERPSIRNDISNYRLLNVGRFDFKVKRQDELVKVFLKSFRADEKYSLTLVGATKSSEWMRLNSISCGDSRVSVLPWLDNIESFMLDYDILIVFSSFEGMPLVVLEALHSGLAVVSKSLPYTRHFSHLETFKVAKDDSALRECVLSCSSLTIQDRLCARGYIEENYDISRNQFLFHSALEGVYRCDS